jgi:hypothetical protein
MRRLLWKGLYLRAVSFRPPRRFQPGMRRRVRVMIGSQISVLEWRAIQHCAFGFQKTVMLADNASAD